MTLQSEQVAHKDLVGGGEIDLHSHAGGGSQIIKIGTITTDALGAASVVFSSAFADANYVISLTAQSPGDATFCMYSGKIAGGFSIAAVDDTGKGEANVTVDWIAIHL